MRFPFTPSNNYGIKNNLSQRLFSGKIFEKKKKKYNFQESAQKNRFENEIKINRKIFLKNSFFFFSVLFLSIFSEGISETYAEDNIRTNKEIKGFSTKSGLKIIEYVEGVDQKPEWGDFITINYVIYKNNSGNLEKLADTYEKKIPFSYIHGNGQTIKGIEEAVHSMKKRGKRRVVIPDELAYNISGLGPIPPEIWKRKQIFQKLDQEKTSNFFLFDIELVDIKKNDFNQKWFNTKIPGKNVETLLYPK